MARFRSRAHVAHPYAVHASGWPLALAACLLACTPEATRAELPAPSARIVTAPTPPAPPPVEASLAAPPSSAAASKQEPVPERPPAAKLGELCGGFAGIACGPGLVCGSVMPVPDGSGTCRKASGAKP